MSDDSLAEGTASGSQEASPPPEGGWTYEAAREFNLRLSLRSTPAERLRDLEAMIDFNAAVEERNPRVKRIAEALASATAPRRRDPPR